jgi:hypothetical protein
MKSSLLTIHFGLVAIAPIVNVASVHAAPAKPTITTSSWQPIARITPGRPYTMQIFNQTGTTLEYGSTTNEFQPRQLTTGKTASISKLPPSVFMLISPLDARYTLKYDVSASNNNITVRVTQLPDTEPGNTTVNVQETGAIYVY